MWHQHCYPSNSVQFPRCCISFLIKSLFIRKARNNIQTAATKYNTSNQEDACISNSTPVIHPNNITPAANAKRLAFAVLLISCTTAAKLLPPTNSNKIKPGIKKELNGVKLSMPMVVPNAQPSGLRISIIPPGIAVMAIKPKKTINPTLKNIRTKK